MDESSQQNSRSRKAIRLIRDSGYLVFGKYGAYLVTLVTLPFIARVLGVTEMGGVSIGMSSYFFGSVFVDFGISQILMASVSRESLARSVRRQYTRLRFVLLLALLIFLSVVLILRWHTGLVFCLGLVAGGLSSANEAYLLYGKQQFKYVTLGQILGRVSYLAAILALLRTFPSATTVLLLLAGSNVVTNVVFRIKTRKIVTPDNHADKTINILKVGPPTAIARILQSMTGTGASAMYAWSVPMHSIGLYSAGDKIFRAVQSLFDSVGVSLLPRAGRLSDDKKAFWAGTKLSMLGGLVIGGLFATCFILLAEPAIRIIYGSSFAEAVPLSQLQALVLPAMGVSSMGINVFLYPRQDVRGILGFSLVGAIVTAIGVCISIAAPGALAMVITSVCTEWSVAFFIVLRAWRIHSRSVAGENRKEEE